MRTMLSKIFRFFVSLMGLGVAIIGQAGVFVPETFRGVVANIVAGLVLLIAVAVSVEAIYGRYLARRPLLSWEDTPQVSAAIVTLAISTWLVTGWICAGAATVYYTFLWAVDPGTGRFPALVLCVPLTFLAGLVLFWVRLRLRTVYGFTEVAAGLTLALWKIIGLAPEKVVLENETMAALLTAGVYVVVRGLDNMYSGWTAKEPDIVVRLWRRGWRRSRPDDEVASTAASAVVTPENSERP